MDSALERYLKKKGIAYALYNHLPVFTVAQASKLKTVIPGMRTKSLFLKDDQERLYLVCMRGEKRLDMKALASYLSVKHLEFASSEELKKELHVTPGSVSLFCMIHAKQTKLILDKEVWDAAEAGFHPNINTATLVVPHESLARLYTSLQCKKEIKDLA